MNGHPNTVVYNFSHSNSVTENNKKKSTLLAQFELARLPLLHLHVHT